MDIINLVSDEEEDALGVAIKDEPNTIRCNPEERGELMTLEASSSRMEVDSPSEELPPSPETNDRNGANKTLTNPLESVHTDKTRLPCNICGASLKNIQSLRFHLVLHREKIKKKKTKQRIERILAGATKTDAVTWIDRLTKKNLYCAHCCTSFKGEKKKRKLLKHLRKCYARKDVFRCKTCGKHFPTRNGLEMHEWHHSVFFCKFCNSKHRRFSDKIALSVHIQHYHKVEYENLVRESKAVLQPVQSIQSPATDSPRQIINNIKEEPLDIKMENMENLQVAEKDSSGEPSTSFKSPETQKEVLKEPDRSTSSPHPRHICDICSEEFPDQTERRIHIKEVHFGIKRERSLTEQVICID
ncbi:myoneurin-like [Lutzomyia longipalpis]|uniref:myoneurin-like n=1 Tax=Lutzomyia longipalpis TaxID=7200 RepID=UPI0024838CFD|nr:myoneurin-like [Lutzomyia longipalpis]